MTTTPHAGAHDHAANLKSIIAMVMSQAVFTANDACVKFVAATLPQGEVMVMRNGMALIYITLFAIAVGGIGAPRQVPVKPFTWRIIAEVFSTFLFFWALVRMPLADVTAIGQFTPLALTAAGAIFLREQVGWRRWLAAIVGLVGVLLIIRPGTSAFTWAALIAIAANGFGILRDLATRAIGMRMSTLALTFTSVSAVFMSGFLLAPFEVWRWPSGQEWTVTMAAGLLLSLGYISLIISLRTGDLAAATPFRYSAVLWALLLGFLIWNELPDTLSMAGIVIVCGAGLYTIHRERIARRSRMARASATPTTIPG